MSSSFFNKKNILIISPEAWSHLPVSKHHYAIELSKSNNVFFLNPPGKDSNCRETQFDNVWEINYPRFIKGIRFLPKAVQRILMLKKYELIIMLVGKEFDCIWSFDNSVFFDFSFLPTRIFKISHIVDHSQNFQFKTAASTADLCLGVSQNIVDRLRVFNMNSFLMPHGVALNNSKAAEIKLPGKNDIKTVYAGNLDSQYLDRDLLFQLIDAHPMIDFIFVGPGGNHWPRKPNMFFVGTIAHEHLFNYLKKSDILLMLYDVNKFPKQLTNAHKLLEYLCAGKIIVSSLVSDYAEYSHLLAMEKRENILKLFSKVASSLLIYNSIELMNMRKNFATQNTYTRRLLEIEKLVLVTEARK